MVDVDGNVSKALSTLVVCVCVTLAFIVEYLKFYTVIFSVTCNF